MNDLLAINRVRRAAAIALTAVVVAVAAGCAQTPVPVELTETQKAVATVEAIDLTSRLVTLKAPDGRPLVVKAGPEVRNLPQVRVGDRVVVSYQEALLAEVIKPGTGSVGASTFTARAAPGERPAAGVVDEVRLPVKIYFVDPAQNIVEVTGPRGYNRRIKVNDPKAREFIRGLKPGDEVEVTFREAFAVSVEPAK
ncbi:MAG TPA: hypothetical protein VLD36_00940 [Burkholderiales bacterium]|nr:hypothetical protein [Burkholderiales bacterium]